MERLILQEAVPQCVYVCWKAEKAYISCSILVLRVPMETIYNVPNRSLLIMNVRVS